MAIFDLFSKRQTDARRAGQNDVYQYSDVPATLRVQVKQIALDAMGRVGSRGDRIMTPDEQNPWWVEIERIYLREKGLERIAQEDFAGSRIILFLKDCSTADWLDFLELIAIAISVIGSDKNSIFRQRWEVSASAAQAIEEINYRLRQAGVGYQIEDSQVVRVDSQYVHAEVVKEALSLISGPGFEGPQQEFMAAHKHYRAGENRQAVAMAANALESTFRAVFDKKGWSYHKGARISDLVKVARGNGLWPDYLDASFDQLLATLQSGLPKIRDNDASHGQGAKPRDVPSYIAGYALHLAASKILFIVQAAK